MVYLSSQSAFKKRYSYNPVVLKSLLAGLVGIGGGAAVAASAANTAATTGWAWVASKFVSWPLIGGLAGEIVKDAAIGAAYSSLPIAIATALGISLPVYFLLRKTYKSFQKNTGLDELAGVVGEIVFLPMLSKYAAIIESKPNVAIYARDSAIERIEEWGYTKNFAAGIVDKYLHKSSFELNGLFESELSEIAKLSNRQMYKNVCLKAEVPPSGLRKLAAKLADDVMPNQG